MYRFRRPFVWCSISDIDAANYHKHRLKEKLNPKFMDIVVNESEFGPYINFGFPGLERSHIHLKYYANFIKFLLVLAFAFIRFTV